LWPCSFLSLNPILPSPAQKHLFTLQQKGVEAEERTGPQGRERGGPDVRNFVKEPTGCGAEAWLECG